MTLREILDWLDGNGIVWVDNDLTEEALQKEGLSLDTELEVKQ